MMAVFGNLPADFLPRLLAGVALNFEIAAVALALGLALGVPLAYGRAASGPGRLVCGLVVPLLRAAPTFVVMFFLLNVMPREITLFGATMTVSGAATVALSLVPYSASYVAENGAEALRHLRRGSLLAALLFLPNVTRAYFVMVMASSAGAAIGVTEGITVILRQAERLADLSDRLRLFALGILVFGVVMQSGFVVVMLVRRYLTRLALRRGAAKAA